MAIQLPFPNDYTLRLVADSDQKPCFICYKPTTSVLLSLNSIDFLYTCPPHLKDPLFATPALLDDYNTLLTKKKDLETKLEKLNKEKELNKPYIWNKLSTYWDKSEKNKEKPKDGEAAPTDKYNQILADISTTQSELTTLSLEISNFKFKKFTLDKLFYKARITNYHNKKQGKVKVEKISKAGFFPSAPKTSLS